MTLQLCSSVGNWGRLVERETEVGRGAAAERDETAVEMVEARVVEDEVGVEGEGVGVGRRSGEWRRRSGDLCSLTLRLACWARGSHRSIVLDTRISAF